MFHEYQKPEKDELIKGTLMGRQFLTHSARHQMTLLALQLASQCPAIDITCWPSQDKTNWGNREFQCECVTRFCCLFWLQSGIHREKSADNFLPKQHLKVVKWCLFFTFFPWHVSLQGLFQQTACTHTLNRGHRCGAKLIMLCRSEVNGTWSHAKYCQSLRVF